MSLISDERVEELLEKEQRLEAEIARLRAIINDGNVCLDRDAAMREIEQLRRALNTVLAESNAEIERLRAALQRVRNKLHAHNRPDVPLRNEVRIALRDICDLALE